MKETEGFTGPIPGKRSVKAKVCFVSNQVVENDVFGFAFQNLSLLGSGGRVYSNSWQLLSTFKQFFLIA